MVNVICLKWGTAYGPEYVNNLYAMVKRNLTLPFRFICFTEDSEGISDNVEIFPLPEFEEPDEKYLRTCLAWRKIALFKKGVANMEGKVLFLDLDIVILDNIDEVFSYSDKLSMIENWYQPGRQIGQASAICFEAGKEEHLLTDYLQNPESVLDVYPTEQAYISGALGKDGMDFFPEYWFQSYKMHCMPSGIKKFFTSENKIPKDAKALVFHGRPNPPDAIKGTWGKKFPWYKRPFKVIKPSPWIADYWKGE